MTKISPEIQIENMILPVSADVSFASNGFPKYKLGPDNQALEQPDENNRGPSLNEVIEQENINLLEQHKRLSVRDLASKFDNNLSSAAKLSDEAKLREVASLEGHVLLKKLRDALEYLKGRLGGRNKGDVEEAISMVEALAVKLTQKEGELIQGKFQVKKLANFLKQASEDAKKLVSQEKSFACAEIESARAVVQRMREVFEQQERNSKAPKKKDVEGLTAEVQEARRIKALHQPAKVMDMELELRALKTQIQHKYKFSVKLQKELTISKRTEERKSGLYYLDGSETLGSYLRIHPCSDTAPQLSKCSIQWYRVSSEGSRKEVISGANKSIYAPEPLDVRRILQAEISSDSARKITLVTAGPIDPSAGLKAYVDTLMRKSNSDFNVTISEMNGKEYTSHSVHIFHVGKLRMKLCRGWITKAREIYSSTMQLCGVRGDHSNAAKALFWQARKGLSYVLTFESDRDRNAAITLARKYALDCNVMLAGPEDEV